MLVIREATFADFVDFRLHPCNIKEVELLAGIDQELALAVLWDVSIQKVSVLIDDNVVCLLGITDPSEIWLFFSKDVTDLPLSFFKVSRKFVANLIETYGSIEGRIYIGNIFALQWAKFMGFTLEPPESFGKEGALFQRFAKERRT